MCCFSGPVRSVGATRIFARGTTADRQALAYTMSFDAASDLAMVLPIPTPVGAREDALAFVDLSGYGAFFDDLANGFPRPQALTLSRPSSAKALAVHRVGAFDASFVPQPSDFARLDPRFRLPEAVVRERPAYADWGFAVFKLRGGEGRQAAHPMAFEFPRRDPGRLFFPTVHVHDGQLASTADFDHTLYAQFDNRLPNAWHSSGVPAKSHVKLERAHGLVDGERPIASRGLSGRLPNDDQWA